MTQPEIQLVSSNEDVESASLPNPLKTLDDILAQIKLELGAWWIADQYKQIIAPMRTRAVALPVSTKRHSPIEINHTLLGIELKIGNQRVTCPDLATARYLRVFARLGCVAVAAPYDISQISRLADELESSWQRMLILVAHFTHERTAKYQSRLLATLTKELKREIEAQGAGAARPTFIQNTRQRPL